jgi:DnaJ-class molecular chaperone
MKLDAPALVHCDFCSGLPFKPQAWNQRTCHRCAADGAPDQSKLEWEDYQEKVSDYLRGKGLIPQLTGAAVAAKKSKGVSRPFGHPGPSPTGEPGIVGA